MMGNQGAGQAPLFYAFNLEDHVPRDHLLRGIDRFLDLSDLRRHLAPVTVRPSQRLGLFFVHGEIVSGRRFAGQAVAPRTVGGGGVIGNKDNLPGDASSLADYLGRPASIHLCVMPRARL